VTERITPGMANTEGHRLRYHLAAGFLERGDVVLDAACGIGYGAEILTARGGVTYVGIDKSTEYCEGPGTFVAADLNTVADFHVEFDVFVGFETIEHLTDYTNYVALAKKATRCILVSAPIVPTKHINPFHLHDFNRGDLVALFADDDWRHFATFDQPSEVSEVVVFVR
jgi:2-polyprenyl-3-methyl-5-hydroxy-6-metoxy-1,4-benzoquinol methylase